MKPFRVTGAVVVSFLSGGLAGNVFNWWINREVPLRISYGISTTSTGSDVTTTSLVPGLVLKIGEQNIPAIHTHVITLNRDRGYADEGTVALTFPTPLEVYGRSFQPPSPLHHINCDSEKGAFACKFGPVDGQGTFQIAIATDKQQPPTIMTAGRDISVVSLEQIAAGRRAFLVERPLDLLAFVIATMSLVTAIAVTAGSFVRRTILLMSRGQQLRRGKSTPDLPSE